MDEHKVFREDSFLRAVAALQHAAEQQQQQQQQQQRRRRRNRNGIQKILLMCEMRNYTPVIVFCFSKRECEANAQALIGSSSSSSSSSNGSSSNDTFSLTSEEERKFIAEIFQNAVNTLDEEDRQLPQIKSILPLLLRGIGIHHGGLLPFVRELIEILFQESLIRVLFSTETFSMGVNMPAKTVVFTAIRKWDGEAYRLINGGEYIQMAGRAGRRGLDDRGIAIIMFDEQVDPEEAKGLFMGGAAPLISTFHLGFNMLLNLFRIEDADPVYMISRSFANFQQHGRSLKLQQELQQLQQQLRAATDIRSLVTLPEGEKEPDFDVEEAISSFYGRKHELLQQGRLLRSIAMQPQQLARFLQPGRLVGLLEDDGTEWGWATCVQKLQKRKVPSTNAHEGPTEQLLVHCLVSCDPLSVQPLEPKGAPGGPPAKGAPGGPPEKGAPGGAPAPIRPHKPRPAPPVGEEGKDYVLEVVPFSVSCVARVSKCKMSLPAGGDVDSADARRSINFQLQIIQEKFKDCGGLPLLDPVVDMKVDHPQLAELVSRMAASEAALKENPFNGHPLCALYYAAQHKRMQMQTRLREIQAELEMQKKTAIKKTY
ncbi:RNA helicase, putative [Eimeria necatrix]|uniref:RNA helicase, putative n=1 Tax=Eimeria necatrix TaxID=51315 RepID=U6N1A3_9EIME|nr:RNA helicase, putative [Eimeria necatrix]CDJ69068.1 RNA helicase, putative [Eimeria necatrix]